MISMEDSKRIEESKKCKECIDWHHHCKSECCKIMYLEIDPERLKTNSRFVDIKVKELRMNEILYHRLRDVSYVRGFLRFPKKNISVVGNLILYIKSCSQLDGYLCKGHPDNKPEICKLVTFESSKIPGMPFRITDNCLFKYKTREDKNGK